MFSLNESLRIHKRLAEQVGTSFIFSPLILDHYHRNFIPISEIKSKNHGEPNCEADMHRVDRKKLMTSCFFLSCYTQSHHPAYTVSRPVRGYVCC